MGCSPSVDAVSSPLPTANSASIDNTRGKCSKHGYIPFTQYNKKDNELYCIVCVNEYKRRNVRNGMNHCVTIGSYPESLTFKQHVVRLEEELRNRKRESDNKQTNLKRSIQTIEIQRNELIDEINAFIETIISLLKYLADDMCKNVSEVTKNEINMLSNTEQRVSAERNKLEEIRKMLDIGKNPRSDACTRLCGIMDTMKGFTQLAPSVRDISQVEVELTLNKSLRLGDIKGTTSARPNIKLGEVNVVRHDVRSDSIDYTGRQSNTVTLTDISEAEDSDLEKSRNTCTESEKTSSQKVSQYNINSEDAHGHAEVANDVVSSNVGSAILGVGDESRRRRSSESLMKNKDVYETSVNKHVNITRPTARRSSTTSITESKDTDGTEPNAVEHIHDYDQNQVITHKKPSDTKSDAVHSIRTPTPSRTDRSQLRRQFERDSTLAARISRRASHSGMPIFSSATPSVRRSSQSIGTSQSITTPSGVRFETKGSNEMTYRKIVKLEQFEVPSDKHKANITDSAFLQDGSLVLCDSKNKCLTLFNSEFEYLDIVYLDSQPHNLTVTSANQVAVSLPNANTICYINIVSGKFSHKSLHKQFRTIGLCRGIACIQGSLLYTTRKEVLILKHTEDDFKYKYEFREPVSLTVDEVNRRLFVSCIGQKSFGEVVVMTTSGKIEFTVSGGKVSQPVGCTLDRERNIYICDVNPPRIHQVTPEGSFSRVLMESETEKYQHINFLPQEDIFLVTSNDSNIVTFYEMV